MLVAAAATVLATSSAESATLHAVGGNCTSDKAQQGWVFDPATDSIKFGSAGCLSEPPNWHTLTELVIAPCQPGEPSQNFTFNSTTGLVKHGANCLALNTPAAAADLEPQGASTRIFRVPRSCSRSTARHCARRTGRSAFPLFPAARRAGRCSSTTSGRGTTPSSRAASTGFQA